MDPSAEVLGPAVEQAIETATGARTRLSGVPVPLSGGLSARLYACRLQDGPEGLPHELVLRMPALGGSVCREGVIQREVARSGYPAPTVFLIDDGPTNPLGRPFLLMAKAPGVTLLADAGPIDVLRAFRRVPALFARLMADLHGVEPAPIAEALATSGVRVDQLGEEYLLAELREVSDACAIPKLRPILDWLAANRPLPEPAVVCHGDLHALNILDAAPRYTVVDWELATIGRPALDVARTSLLLSAVPVDMSRRARGVVQRLGRRSAAQFREAYAARRPLDEAAVCWCEALHIARILGRLMRREVEAQPQADPVLDAWAPTAPYLIRQLHELTGIAPRN